MKAFGMTSAAEFLGDNIVYRNLKSADPQLPDLEKVQDRLGLPAGSIPRKHELEYARVVAHLLESARQRDGSSLPLRRLVFIGDSEMLDGQAFTNLCRVQGWPGLAFIGAESGAPAQARLVGQPEGPSLYLANRWTALEEFDRYCAQVGLRIDEQTAVVIDLDKTILGARGRNSHLIDQARSKAMEQTIAGLLGDQFDSQLFYQVYRQFNQPLFHPFTSDNQDYLAYICLMALAGLVEASILAQAVQSGAYQDFRQFVSQMEARCTGMPASVAAAHADVYQRLQAGDPTVFKAFRRTEYALTVSLMGCMPLSTPVEDLLKDEIVLTQEVRQAALEWRSRGALLFALSDKPDEASVPTPEQQAHGFSPLHRTLTHAVGA